MRKPGFTCYDYVADSHHQKCFPRIFLHINIYDEGAAFPFAHISQNESLYTQQYFNSHRPVRDQHKPSLLWTLHVPPALPQPTELPFEIHLLHFMDLNSDLAGGEVEQKGPEILKGNILQHCYMFPKT